MSATTTRTPAWRRVRNREAEAQLEEEKAVEVTEEVMNYVREVLLELQLHLGGSKTKKWEPVCMKVHKPKHSGTNYFIHLIVDNQHVHIRIWKSEDGFIRLGGLVPQKKANVPLKFF